MKVVSPIYQNMNLKFNGKMIAFKNGQAEISEELYDEIVKSGFPNIFQEGANPKVKTEERKEYDNALQALNEEYMLEIDRLKGIVETKNQEISEWKEQVRVWKELYKTDTEKLKAQLSKVQVNTVIPQESPVVNEPAKEIKNEEASESAEILEDEEKAVRADLEAMKLTELQTLALKEGVEEDKVKKAGSKKNLIDLIMGKNEE